MRLQCPGSSALISLSAPVPPSYRYKMELKQSTTAVAVFENVAKQNRVKKLKNISAHAL